MKKLMVLMAALLCGSSLFAQDIITKKDGTDIKAKVLEVGQTEVSYKRFSNPDGPNYTIAIDDILMITFENGDRDMFNSESKKSSMPQGLMTYNSWSGKISVGGETIENDLLDRYFTPEDMKMYKTGKTMDIIGGIIGIAGAIPFGYGAGYVLGWNLGGGVKEGEYAQSYNSAKKIMAVGGVALAVGLLISLPGEAKMKKAINNYNQSLSYRPEFSIGATENGFGLAYRF